jgi:hypothetical protein
MLGAVTQLIKHDIESNTDWIRGRISLQIRSIAIIAAFGVLAFVCAAGLLTVALFALYVWARDRYGFDQALGLVAIVLTASMLLSILSILIVSRSRSRAAPAPHLQVTDPSMLKSALLSDVRATARHAFHRTGETPLGVATSAHEQVAEKSEQTASAVAKLREKPGSTLLLALGALVAGVAMGRRL